MQSVWQPHRNRHVLEECEVLHLVGEYKVYSNEIFSNNTNNLKTTTNIKYILDQLHNQPIHKEGSTTTTTCTTQQLCTARPTKDSSPPVTRGRTQWWWWCSSWQRMSRPVTQAAKRERELGRARSQRLKQAVRSLPGEPVSPVEAL